MPYFRINHDKDIAWKDDERIFVIVMASHIAPGGLSDFVFTNGKYKELSGKVVTTGHFAIVPLGEFDVMVESGIMGLVNTMQLVGVEPLRKFLDTVAVARPLSYGVLRQVLMTAEQYKALAADDDNSSSGDDTETEDEGEDGGFVTGTV